MQFQRCFAALFRLTALVLLLTIVQPIAKAHADELYDLSLKLIDDPVVARENRRRYGRCGAIRVDKVIQ